MRARELMVRDPRQGIRRRALEAGLDRPAGETWWPELAPLSRAERQRVKEDVAQVQAMAAGNSQGSESTENEAQPSLESHAPACAFCGDRAGFAWRCPDCGAVACSDCRATNLDCYDAGRKCPGCGKALPDADGSTDWAEKGWAALGYAAPAPEVA